MAIHTVFATYNSGMQIAYPSQLDFVPSPRASSGLKSFWDMGVCSQFRSVYFCSIDSVDSEVQWFHADLTMKIHGVDLPQSESSV
jgi:hypothetical protein